MQIEQYIRNCSDEKLKNKFLDIVETKYDGDFYKLLPWKGPAAPIEGWGVGGAEQWKFEPRIGELITLGLLEELP